MIGEARAIGYQRIILDSHVSMTRGPRHLCAAGFRQVEAPADFPEALIPVVVFMELDLTRPPT